MDVAKDEEEILFESCQIRKEEEEGERMKEKFHATHTHFTTVCNLSKHVISCLKRRALYKAKPQKESFSQSKKP